MNETLTELLADAQRKQEAAQEAKLQYDAVRGLVSDAERKFENANEASANAWNQFNYAAGQRSFDIFGFLRKRGA